MPNKDSSEDTQFLQDIDSRLDEVVDSFSTKQSFLEEPPMDISKAYLIPAHKKAISIDLSLLYNTPSYSGKSDATKEKSDSTSSEKGKAFKEYVYQGRSFDKKEVSEDNDIPNKQSRKHAEKTTQDAKTEYAKLRPKTSAGTKKRSTKAATKAPKKGKVADKHKLKSFNDTRLEHGLKEREDKIKSLSDKKGNIS